MKKNLLTILLLAGLLLPTNIYGQIQSNGTGGGDWNTGTTWQGGVVPDSSSNVVILGTDSVFLTSEGRCLNLTMNAAAILNVNSSGLSIPGTSWNLDQTSTVYFVGPTTVQSDPVYGNLVYGTSSNGGVSTTSPGNLTVMGNFFITSSTFRGIATTSGSVTHTVAGNVIVGPGTGARISGVNQSSATTASCVWNIGGNVSLISGNSGNRLILYESAGPHTGSAVFNIDGNLNIAGGSQIMFKSSSSTSNDYPEGIINLKGNLEQDGTIGINSGTGNSPGLTINFIGTNVQHFVGPGNLSVSTFSLNFNINNAAGVNLGTTKTLGNRINLTLTNGNLFTNLNNSLIVTSGTITGGSSSSLIDGPMAYQIDVTTPVEVTYPIGKGDAYRPLTLNVTQDFATAILYFAEMMPGMAPSNTFPLSLDKVSSVRYFTITKDTMANIVTATVKLSYEADDNVTDFANLRIAKDDGAGNWVNLGGTGTANTSGTITSTVNFTSVGDFVLANNTGGGNVIPVEMTSLRATADNNIVTLNWTTATESNNYGFEIERAVASNRYISWKSIGFVNGAGNSTEQKNYSFSDKVPQSGSYLYRLRQIDLDGNFTFSKELNVSVSAPQNFSLLQNYPNPFNPSTSIEYSIPSDSRVTIEIFSVSGEKIALLVNDNQPAGYHSYQLDAGALKLSSGVYVYKLTAVGSSNQLFTQSRKMILLK